MPLVLRRVLAVFIAVLAISSAFTACGEDIPTKDEFIEQMKTRVEDRTLSAAVYGCTYDAIRKDRKLLDAAMSDKPSDEATAELRTIFSKCVLDAAAPASTTTTTAKKPAPSGSSGSGR